MSASACVCVLLYGGQHQHEKLARRILNPAFFALNELGVEFRFGLNAVGSSTRKLVQTCAEELNAPVVLDGPNIYKYPMMRALFQKDTKAPITMWFDHDSYLDLMPVDVPGWFSRLTRLLANCDMLGSVYRGSLNNEQKELARQQSWYVEDAPHRSINYALGGWWAIRTAVLQKFNWPPHLLSQKNGDIILGELLAQQRLSLAHFRDGLKINVNTDGVEGATSRTITM